MVTDKPSSIVKIIFTPHDAVYNGLAEPRANMLKQYTIRDTQHLHELVAKSLFRAAGTDSTHETNQG